MDAVQANVFLSRLRLLDPRFAFEVPADPAKAAEHAVLAAETWAEVLRDVGFEEAIAAAVEHYRESPHRLMPVDVLSRCAAVDPEAERARAAWLASHGLTEAQVRAMPRHELEAIMRGDREVTRGA